MMPNFTWEVTDSADFDPTMSNITLKRVCHEIFWVPFWHVWIELGLYKNL